MMSIRKCDANKMDIRSRILEFEGAEGGTETFTIYLLSTLAGFDAGIEKHVVEKLTCAMPS